MHRAAALAVITVVGGGAAHAQSGAPAVLCEAQVSNQDGTFVEGWSARLGGTFRDKKAVEQTRALRLRGALVNNSQGAGEGFTFPNASSPMTGAVEFISIAAPGAPERAQLHVYAPLVTRLAEVAFRSFTGKDPAPSQAAVRVSSGGVTHYARAPIKPAPDWAGWSGGAHVAAFGAESAWIASKPTDIRPLMKAFEQSGRMRIEVLVPKKFALDKPTPAPEADTPADLLSAAAFEVTMVRMKDAVAGLRTLTPVIGRMLAAGECGRATTTR